MTVPVALRGCHHCGKPQDEVSKMMRCSKCAVVNYCGKECQKAAWPTHKSACRVIDEKNPERIMKHAEVQPYGFQTVDEFSQALRDFIEAHSWTFQSYTKAHVLLEGGADNMNNPPKIMEIRMQCLCKPGAARNPAHTFSFMGHVWRTVEESLRGPMGARNWARNAALRETVHRQHSSHPRFVGLLTVLFAVYGITTTQTFLYPQFRSTSAFFRPGPAEAEVKRMLTDIVMLCTVSVHFGLALRCAEGQESIAALPGRFVRSNKLWTWEPLFTDWDAYLAGPRGIKYVDALLEMIQNPNMSVPDLLRVIRVVC